MRLKCRSILGFIVIGVHKHMTVMQLIAEKRDRVGKFSGVLILLRFLHHRHIFFFECGKVNFLPFLQDIDPIHILYHRMKRVRIALQCMVKVIRRCSEKIESKHGRDNSGERSGNSVADFTFCKRHRQQSENCYQIHRDIAVQEQRKSQYIDQSMNDAQNKRNKA